MPQSLTALLEVCGQAVKEFCCCASLADFSTVSAASLRLAQSYYQMPLLPQDYFGLQLPFSSSTFSFTRLASLF